MTKIAIGTTAAAWAVAIALSACSTGELLVQSGLPGGRAAAALDLVAERGDYLDVTVTSGGARFRFFLPDDAACRALFVGEQAVTYENGGVFGQLRAGDTTCDPVGILSLEAWRDRRPHHQAAGVIPRDRAQLRERVFGDDELALIRGRFRLAVQVGLMGGEDIIAVIPVAPECEGLPVPGSVSMEFRPAGPRVFTLVNDGALCDVIGFVLPPPDPAP